LQDSQIIDKDGAVSLRNLGNILFADRFPTGVAGAVAACPANGCIIYALAPDVDRNLGSIDPGTKSITIYLGPYTFKVNTITLRKGMKIIGMGASQSYSGTAVCTTANPCNGTALQSVNGNKPVFVIYYAHLFDLLGSGRVISVDIANSREGLPKHPRIEFLRGSSTSPEILTAIKNRVRPDDKVMVILDSDHTKEHVAEELKLYSALVSRNCYLVVEDTNVNGHPVMVFSRAGTYGSGSRFPSIKPGIRR
jgi:Cephalosporin hydroxylase